MARFINSDTRKIGVVAESGIDDPSAPTAAELNAGTDITCAVVNGHTLGFTPSDTVNEPAVCDTANAATPTRDNYGADLTLFRAEDSDTNTVYSEAKDALTGKGAVVYIYERISSEKGAEDDFAAGDVVTFIGRFVLDNPISVAADSGWEKFQVQPLMDGWAAGDVEVDAGTSS